MTERSNSGPIRRSTIVRGEDPDFDYRFRQDTLRRWLRGVRNGIDPISLLKFKLGWSEEIRFHGVTVQQSDNQATYRLIHDIWMRGEYELPCFTPRKNWRVIEIGANVGIYAMLAASKGASVTAYEPSPSAFERLRANTSKWAVECHNVAVVGTERSDVRLYLHPARDTRNTVLGARGVNNTSSKIAGDKPLVFQNSISVPCLSIKAVLRQPCDLLKIACEGAEFEIIACAGDVLSNAKRIVIELHSEMCTEYGGVAELTSTIRKAGFDITLHEPLPGLSRQFLTACKRSEL